MSRSHNAAGGGSMSAEVPAEAWRFLELLSGSGRIIRRLENDCRLGVADRRLLWLAGAEGPRTMSDIADRLDLDLSTVNRQVRLAEDRGIVERSRTTPGSAMLVQATEHGRSLLVADVALLGDFAAQALSALDLDRRESFLGDVAKVVDSFSE